MTFKISISLYFPRWDPVFGSCQLWIMSLSHSYVYDNMTLPPLRHASSLWPFLSLRLRVFANSDPICHLSVINTLLSTFLTESQLHWGMIQLQCLILRVPVKISSFYILLLSTPWLRLDVTGFWHLTCQKCFLATVGSKLLLTQWHRGRGCRNEILKLTMAALIRKHETRPRDSGRHTARLCSQHIFHCVRKSFGVFLIMHPPLM